MVTAAISLIDVLLRPPLLTELGGGDLTRILRQARHAGLLGFIEARVDPEKVSGKLADHLLGARIHADYNKQTIAWECKRLAAVLKPMPGPVILLKGAAYKALDLGLAQGRLASDVDLLVPKRDLGLAERLLLNAGWSHMKADEYDQHYYREWMHELPPLRHIERGTVVDLHHGILPPTARLKPDPAQLISAARPIAGSPFFTLSPEDSVLHRAVHLFFDGELANSLRELVDIGELLSAFAQEQQFEQRLVSRAGELGVSRPLYYAIHFCSELLQSDIARSIATGLHAAAPAFPARQLILAMMRAQLIPADPDHTGSLRRIAANLLYLRSHWQRMPPLMLARHLVTQIRRRGGIKSG
ncbi:MAG: nucleotidyltransferase family protein [Chromatiaceae bacterium]|nr:nucleotidyltransferase family protein [Chromatiaceae bacterium]